MKTVLVLCFLCIADARIPNRSNNCKDGICGSQLQNTKQSGKGNSVTMGNGNAAGIVPFDEVYRQYDPFLNDGRQALEVGFSGAGLSGGAAGSSGGTVGFVGGDIPIGQTVPKGHPVFGDPAIVPAANNLNPFLAVDPDQPLPHYIKVDGGTAFGGTLDSSGVNLAATGVPSGNNRVNVNERSRNDVTKQSGNTNRVYPKSHGTRNTGSSKKYGKNAYRKGGY